MTTDINGYGTTHRFSIKSRMGGNTTLLSTCTSTNFIYKIRNKLFTNSEIKFVNSINTVSRYRDRINYVLSNSGKFSFTGVENETFKLNLQMIDSKMPIIISTMILNYYAGNANNLIDLLKDVEQENPCNYNLDYNNRIYEYKIKILLTEIVLGKMPVIGLQRHYNALEKYFVVKENGDRLFYNMHKRKEFEDYILENTELYTSSNMHKFGVLYKEGKNIYMKLNLQIRFKE